MLDDINATFFGDRVQQEISNRIGLYIAPGYAIQGNTLVFFKFGFTRANQSYTRESRGVALDKVIKGKLFGLGIKHAITENIYIGADITKYHYGMNSWVTNINPYEVFVTSKTEQTDASVSFGYKF